MSMSFINNKKPLLTKEILKNSFLKNDPFFLVDVGASGGIGYPWTHLEDSLKAIGIDPLIAECDRLNKDEKRPMVKYISAFAVAENEKDQFQYVPEECYKFFQRSSADEAIKNTKLNFIKENFNSGADIVYSNQKDTLNNLLRSEKEKVNFLKVDTDGFDICVLKGADKILKSPNLIGAVVECQFLGAKGLDSNVFSNIERYLAEFGFCVYSMDVNRYSRHHLPSKFIHNLFAFTEKGQSMWADVLFIKDPLSIDLNRELAFKYLIVFELFNLHDCAAELLVERSDLFEAEFKDYYLDLLARQYYNGKISYKEALKKYIEDPNFYFPRNYNFDSTSKVGKKIASKLITSAAPYFSRSFKDKIKNLISTQK